MKSNIDLLRQERGTNNFVRHHKRKEWKNVQPSAAEVQFIYDKYI